MSAKRLSPDQLERVLASLPEWTLYEGHMRRTYKFADFVEAFAFMTAAAMQAHALDHHPDWSNSYDTVRVDLVTHDANGITANDVELARRFEALAARWTR